MLKGYTELEAYIFEARSDLLALLASLDTSIALNTIIVPLNNEWVFQYLRKS